MNPFRLRALWFLIVVVMIVAARPAPVHAQFKRKSGTGFTEIQWQDYTFKFLPGNRMAQVINSGNHVIGTILDQGGDLQLLPTVTGDEAAKLQKAFQAWKDSGGEAAVGYTASTPSTSAKSSGAGTATPSAATAAKPAASTPQFSPKPVAGQR